MSNTAIVNLQSAIKAAAGAGAFPLDADFLTKGMNDPSVVAPANYDANIKAAFQVAAVDFKVTVSAANVGPVDANDTFTVTGASIPFLGGSLASEATLVFGVTKDGATLVVQILSAPANWTWTNSFSFMNGWPFTQLAVTSTVFIFSTADGFYPWTVTSGRPVSGGAKQNFFSSIPLPDVVAPVLALIGGLTPPTGSLNLQGVFDMSAYNGETVLYPSGTLEASLGTGTFTIFYLNVTNPRVRLTIPPPGDAATEGEEATDQTPQLTVATGLGVQGNDIDYTLQIDINITTGDGQGNQVDYVVGLFATGDGSEITPATVISLIGGSGSYLAATPPVLQQFLTSVGLRGLTLAGSLSSSPTLDTVSVQIGSTKGTTWTPIPFAPPGLNFTITDFSLLWSIDNPLTQATRQFSYVFETSFTLATDIFKGPNGQGDGLFTVQFTSGLQFYAAFVGTASLSNFLKTLTGNAISLPSSIQAELSDITLSVDYNAKSFSFTSGFALSLAFLTYNGNPVISISDGLVRVSAITPPTQNPGTQSNMLMVPADAGAATSWSSAISGLLTVGPFVANVSVAYSSVEKPPRWTLSASLAQELAVTQLIAQFFDPGGTYPFPSFLLGDLKIQAFAIEAVIPSGANGLATTYSIDTTFNWIFTFGGQNVGIDTATISLKYDGAKTGPKEYPFTGKATGTWVYKAIDLKLLFGYEFLSDGNSILFVDWEGFRATYSSGKEIVTFTLKGWSLGSLIQALVRTLGDPYFVLSSPWDLLNEVSLDGLAIILSLKDDDPNRLSASYTLSSPLDLGFIKINKLIFRRNTDRKVLIAIDGTISPLLLGAVSPEDKKKLENLTKADTGQDVKDMPSVPGRGNSYFKVFLLVLGQRIGITGYTTFQTTKEVIDALVKVPSTTGKMNPVDPNANKQPAKGVPYYNQGNNWIVAAHLGIMEVAGVWTIDAMVVFNDPNLYGLRLALNGPKVGGLKNLTIDILYKKITDDIGVYQIEFTFPDAIRNLNFGTVSITLPQLGVKVYTNGDFFIDIGFPYNLDFRRSFSIAAIVYGVPVLGSGGLYFGKLSSATSTQVPVTTKGTFDPVVVFGLGLQLGLGYNFTKGPLSAGFALTFFGIIEGVIAAWHPYDGNTGSNSLMDDYYFKISGMVGVIGLLYGKVDFVIIKATVNVKITLSLQISYESYRAIPLVARATVDISVDFEVDLGLFSFTITFTFSATVSATFVLGSDQPQNAPWFDGKQAPRLTLHAALLTGAMDPALLAAPAIVPRPKRVLSRSGAEGGVQTTAPTLNLLTSPQFTVLAPEGSTSYAAQQGAFAFLTAMDAPNPKSDNNTGDTSFDKLCAAFFPWVIDLLSVPTGNTVDLELAAATIVTKAQLEAFIKRLADNANPAFTVKDLLTFLGSAFILNIDNPETARTDGLEAKIKAGAMIFPVFDGLSLAVPDPSGGDGSKPIDFTSYTTATPAYRATVGAIFDAVEAAIDAMNQKKPVLRAAPDETPESMAGLIFVDTFAMIGRELLQAADNALTNYAYHLQDNDSVGSIIKTIGGDTITVNDVAIPNQDHKLSPSIPLTIANLTYTIQAADTLNSIAATFSDSAMSPRWMTTASAIIGANPIARILRPDVPLSFTIGGKPVVPPYITTPGDTFQHIADTLEITLAELQNQSVLYDAKDLLVPAQVAAIPQIAYTTAAAGTGAPSADSLASVAALFATTVPNVADANVAVPNLFSKFDQGGTIALANLLSLSVADLWKSITATDQVAQTAGMVSRFLVYGLRLPRADGLGFSGEFLYPTAQKGYGVYQLTGQQFPTPTSATAYNVTLSRAGQFEGVDLSFIQFNNAVGTSVTVSLQQSFNLLSTVLKWAQSGAFTPSPTFQYLPLSSEAPKAFAVNNFAYFSTSDMATLLSLTSRATGLAAEGGSKVQPILWPLPPSLTTQIAARQSVLEPLFPSLTDLMPLLPQFQPQFGSTSPATQQTDYADLHNWAWTTRVDFQIKRLPLVAGSDALETGAGSIPAGPAMAPSLPNAYEVIGASSADTVVLEELLSAMDTLGEDIASSVFVTYAQSGASQPTLTTLGSQEFLTFLTQTNLSTETNPLRSALLALAAEDSAPPRGVANSPGEFVKLLWELSTVRSGGYFLYYQVVNGGDGLPASLFDTSGTATLSMVVTYATKGKPSFGKTVPNFVNGFVTTDSLDTSRDVVQVVSQRATAPSAGLTGKPTETLATIAAMYGADPGRIAEENPTVVLVHGSVIPVKGIVHQLTEADLVNPSQTLNNLAAYYSVGARQAISGQDIANANPGVPVQLASVFYIPLVNYVVASATPGAGPGDSFGSMTAYYGVSFDAIAVMALNVGGLFPAQSTLTIDTQVFDLRSTLGPGNIGIRLERENYGPPVTIPDGGQPKDPNAYAQAYMYSLYNTLSAGLAANSFFDVSPMSMPFGPQDQTAAGSSAFASHESARLRRASRLLSAAALPMYDYRQSLGFAKFSRINAAPDGGGGLPVKADNPYVGVGSTAQISLRWQDIFGNITVTPFDAPPPGYSAALNGSAAPVLYNDLLIGLGGWPNAKPSYIYKNPSSPELDLSLTLDVTTYASSKDTAARDLKLYQQIYFQLHQNYKDLGIPGVSGNAVTMSLINSLLFKPVTELTDTQADVIRKFVRDCVVYLAAVGGTGSLPPVPTATLTLPVSLTGLATDNIIQLDVNLVFERNQLLTDPTVAALTNGLAVSTTIMPQADGGPSVAYVEFAKAFESVFKSTGAWYMKVGEGLKQADSPDATASQQLWAVRFGNAAGQGIYFELGTAPSYYAPKPVAMSLKNQTTTIIDYTTGQSVTMSFTGVDQNLWFQNCLDAIDSFLSATYSSSTFILDKILGTNDPLVDGYLGKVLADKQSLADNISSTVKPILSTSATDASTSWAAGEKLRQQLLNQIGAAYAAGASTVFSVNNASGAPAGAAGPASLYGQPGGEIGAGAANQNYALSSSRIPLGPTTVDGKTYDPRVSFVFTSKNVVIQDFVPLNLGLPISHLEFDRVNVPGIKGYVQSRWLAFVTGTFSYALGKGVSNIPVVNRALPTPPVVQAQTAGQPATPPATPFDLVKWNYSFDYTYQQAAQDTMVVDMELNVPSPDGSLKAAAAGPDLFTALAQFITSYPAIVADFNAYLVRIGAKTPDQTVIDNAKKAVSSFAEYLHAVATAYAATLQPQAFAAAGLPQLVKIHFEAALDQTAEGYARTDIINVTINDIAATYSAANATISNGSITLPAMVLQILPDTYTATSVPPPAPTVTIAYLYEAPGPEGTTLYLPYGQALATTQRTVMMASLDALNYQNAQSAISVLRNKILFPIEDLGSVSTTSFFLFQTPAVRFADAIVPLLRYASFPLDPLGGTDLAALLNKLFQGMFTGGNGSIQVDVSMTGAYSYSLLPGTPRILLPINLLPPIETAVDPSATPSFTAPFADVINVWRASQGPTLQGDPQVDIKLFVYGASTAKQPLLVVDDVFQKVS